jgi:hypothetical protein
MPLRPNGRDVTAERLRELFIYDELHGIFLRRVTSGGQTKGTIAGTLRKDGYIDIRVNHYKHLAHRLAWLYVYGEWPKEWLDHINGNRALNAMSNLREVTHAQNTQNARVKKNSGTGVKGVHQRKDRYHAHIHVEGKRRHLGSFATIQEAAEAYAVCAKKYRGEFARLS